MPRVYSGMVTLKIFGLALKCFQHTNMRLQFLAHSSMHIMYLMVLANKCLTMLGELGLFFIPCILADNSNLMIHLSQGPTPKNAILKFSAQHGLKFLK